MINPYLAGRNQYGGTSSANKGMTLNPTGYVQRESDKRSQLAQNFMQNQQNSVMQPQAGTVTGLTNNFDQRTATGRIKPMLTDIQNEPFTPVTAPEGQPTDAQYNQEAFEASSNYQNQARSLLEARQQAELNYGNQTRGLQQILDKLPGQLRSEAARRGLLRSTYFTGNLESQEGEIAKQIDSALADQNIADKAWTTGLLDLKTQYGGLMGLAAQTLASRNAANAGKLGLGTPDNQPFAESEIGKKIQEMIDSQYRGTGTNVTWPDAITPPQQAAPPATAPSGGGISIPAGTYRQGYNNPALVKQIQQLVGTKVDGIWGKNTTAAIKAWQAAHGLTADGVIGKNTIAAMAGG